MKLNPVQRRLQEQLGLVYWRLQFAPAIPADNAAQAPEHAVDAADRLAPPVQFVAADTVPEVVSPAVPLEAAVDEQPTQVKPDAQAHQQASSVKPAHETARGAVALPVQEPCRIIWGGADDAPRQRLQADLVRLLESQGVAWQSFQEQPGLALPPAPTLCFVLKRGNAYIDEVGRMLLPQQPGALPALAWKPQLWAYLQGIFDQRPVAQHQPRTK